MTPSTFLLYTAQHTGVVDEVTPVADFWSSEGRPKERGGRQAEPLPLVFRRILTLLPWFDAFLPHNLFLPWPGREPPGGEHATTTC